MQAMKDVYFGVEDRLWMKKLNTMSILMNL